MDNKEKFILGLDIGSVSLAAVLVDENLRLHQQAYIFHHGDIRNALMQGLAHWPWSQIYASSATISTPKSIRIEHRYDNYISLIEGSRWLMPEVASILNIGGEKFNLIRFDKAGNYESNKKNTSCAAGTGSFLDQQANRLGLADIATFSSAALTNQGQIPKIASHCAVFAKTDLIHAQQEGYTIAEIADGLCLGLSKNIVDVLIAEEKLSEPVLVTGSVAKNAAVVRHLEELLGCKLHTDPRSHLLEAMGAVVHYRKEHSENLFAPQALRLEELYNPQHTNRKYQFDSLQLHLTEYPDFDSWKRYEQESASIGHSHPVEVDIYLPIVAEQQLSVYLGIDIGSTSTKAALLLPDGDVLAGFYTKTAAKPLYAVKALLYAIDQMQQLFPNFRLIFLGTGTTGSGRKFIGQIIGADLMVDEITAHARAAFELNPETDTIIEIGGQDAKFTTMRHGRVTFSIMNNVCAAGTGSFIEEQAGKLDCSLAMYAGRAEGQRAPMASDRCTVFMERDINHLIQDGYEVDEVLATVLHSVRENYLTKVAIEKNIGEVVCFQGATAKNRALVAAFEQRLGKPIFVSKFCHLTGALGTALLLREEKKGESSFRGLSLYRQDIPIRSEICELCTNHCKVTIAEVSGQSVAYGFLCGRDLETQKFVNKNTSGFDLLKAHKKTFHVPQKVIESPIPNEFTVGLPASLHIAEDIPFWQLFFDKLNVKTVHTGAFKGAVKIGKKMSGAEFCAPMAAFHGHVAEAASKSDYLFLPYYLDNKKVSQKERRQYCYYTQFAPSLTTQMMEQHNGSALTKNILSPIIKYLYSPFFTKKELYYSLKQIKERKFSFWEISDAFDYARKEMKERQSSWKELLKTSRKGKDGDFSVVFLGRPYTVLSRDLNKGIPEIFANHGIMTFYQDMLSYTPEDVKRIQPLLKELHWNFAAKIMESAEVIANDPNLYPVFITSFMCSPDSFILDYFKELMDYHHKPYLILQLDEHDSSVGYETRIEASIRAFRNHFQKEDKLKPQGLYHIPMKAATLTGKTILLPNWDEMSIRLIAANLRHAGYDARLLTESEELIQKSLRHNSGQCIPMNIIAEEFIAYLRTHNLDPAKTVLWMIDSPLACNIKLYPYHIKKIVDQYAGDLSAAQVYGGQVTYEDLSYHTALMSYLAYMFGGLLKRAGTRYRPYEIVPGSTDKAIAESLALLEKEFEQEQNFSHALYFNSRNFFCY